MFCRNTVFQYFLECLFKSLKNKGYIPEASLWKLYQSFMIVIRLLLKSHIIFFIKIDFVVMRF
jgi:hypothetical protein